MAPPKHVLNLTAPCAIGLLVSGCVLLNGGEAHAQMSGAFTDAFAPKLQAPQSALRFQRYDRDALAKLAETAMFAPAGSGAGTSGFDSTNTRKSRSRINTKNPAKAQAIAPGVPVAQAPSAYDKSTDITASVPAGTPGAPPVQLGPIRPPLKKRKAHTEPEDPYAPLGIRTGAFDLFPAVDLVGGYNTNPGQVPNGKAAWFYTVLPELRAQSNWSRHELKADLRGSYIGYTPDETPSLNRPYVNGRVDGRIDVTHETRVDLAGRILVSTDNPGSPNLQVGLAKLPIYTTGGGTAGIGQRFNRFDVSVKGGVERTVYQQSQLADGSTASNDDRNYDQYAVTLRGGYELSPGLKPFAEIIADKRVHDLNTDFSGYQRNSNGLTGKVGATFELSRLLTGEAALGYTRRSYEDPRLDDISGLIGDASLIYTANALTTLKLIGRSTIGESTIPGVSGVLYRDVGVQVDHAFRRWLVGSLKFGFGVDDYVGNDRLDKRYSAGAGLTYKLNRSVQIKSEFRQDWLQSNVSGVDYTASIVMLGVRVQR